MKNWFLIILILMLLSLPAIGDNGERKVEVSVGGVVKKPGLYRISPTATFREILKMAGGLLSDYAGSEKKSHYRVVLYRGDEIFSIKPSAWNRVNLSVYPLKSGDGIEYPVVPW